MRVIISILMVSLLLFGCADDSKSCRETFQEQYFYSALSNFSSSPNYLIVKVKDGNTGVLKEICTDSESLSSAIIDEYSYNFLDSLLVQKQCKLILEFKQPITLQDIGFVRYNPSTLDSLRKIIPKTVFDSIATLPRFKSFEKVWSFSKGIENNYFEHLMIENKIGCKRDDETGVTIPVITVKDTVLN